MPLEHRKHSQGYSHLKTEAKSWSAYLCLYFYTTEMIFPTEKKTGKRLMPWNGWRWMEMTLLFTMFLLWKYLPCSNEIFPLVSPHPLLPPLPAAHHCDATDAVSTHAWDRKVDIFSKPFTFALLCLPNDAKRSAVLASIVAECSGISKPVLGWCRAVFLPSCPWIAEGPIG